MCLWHVEHSNEISVSCMTGPKDPTTILIQWTSLCNHLALYGYWLLVSVLTFRIIHLEYIVVKLSEPDDGIDKTYTWATTKIHIVGYWYHQIILTYITNTFCVMACRSVTYNRNTAWLRDTVRQTSRGKSAAAGRTAGPPRPLTSRGTSAWPYRVTTQYSFYPVQMYS